METNIYIQAMEIGYSHNEGITYKGLKKLLQLKTLEPIEGRREYTFIKWFIKNFDAPLMPIQGSEVMKRYYRVLVKSLRDKENLQAYRDFSNKTYFLKREDCKTISGLFRAQRSTRTGSGCSKFFNESY